VAVIVIALFIFTRVWCTPTHVQSKSSSDFDSRSRSTKLACMYCKRGSCPILERLVDLRNW